jgi:peroxiredoxin
MPVPSDAVPVGSAAPDFELILPGKDQPVKLSSLRGQPVVLVFLRGFR